MRKDLTELVFILDRSGSMYPLVSDTIGGFNGVLEENRKLPGECRVTTILFNDEFMTLHDHLPIRGIANLTEKDYRPGGSTALLDAVGQAIEKLDGIQEHTIESERAEKVQFVIITDGFENASTKFNLQRVRRMISARKEQGWDFLFLGANMDAVSVAGTMGIHADRAVEMMSDGIGTSKGYEAVSRANISFRTGCAEAPRAWKAEVEEDTRRRKPHK
ncbi:MAG: VWA domain-containing protein [Clostridia bacterium]|nr:VWA domain-containing protein [Clostridia bacterium]